MLCAYCKQEFLSGNNRKKYCSSKCYNDAKSKRHYNKKNFAVTCKVCNKEFMAGRSDALHCSEDCTKKSVSAKLTKYQDIPSCLESADRKLDKHLGYVRVYVPMHPEANTWGYVYEHRVIAEKIIGRSLFQDEIVHHKNGKRWDNRPENLEVMNKNDHAKLHGQREDDLKI